MPRFPPPRRKSPPIFISTTNPYNFGLLVSTNYINPAGFQTGISSPNNVNYFYPNGTLVSGADFNLLMANLFFSPRVPVLLSNIVTHAIENRFYLDLNRNGVDDPASWVYTIRPPAPPIFKPATRNGSVFWSIPTSRMVRTTRSLRGSRSSRCPWAIRST